MIKIFEDKQGKLQKILIMFIIAALIFLVPLAAQNETGSEDQPLEEPADLCEGVICEDTSIECPDGFIASCSNSCNTETGECSSCEPDCTGHEQVILEENVSETSLNETLPSTSLDTNV